MIFAFGSYKHQDNEATISTHQDQVPNGEGAYSLKRLVFQIRGALISDNQADLTAALLALETAYTQQNVDFVVYQNDGSTPSVHYIQAANCISVRARVLPSYPESAGEYVYFRKYEIQIEAMMPVNPAEPLISFTETVQLFGGGAEYYIQEAVQGPPTVIQLKEQTHYAAIQVGSAIGVSGLPALAVPLFPQGMLDPKRQMISPVSPIRETFNGALAYSRFTISWSFFFQSPSPINILPRAWT